MRIAANPGPFYSDRAHAVQVTIDGVPLTTCLEADDAAGWADVLLVGPSADVAALPTSPESVRDYVPADYAYGDEPPKRRLQVARLVGDVRITFDPPEAA